MLCHADVLKFIRGVPVVCGVTCAHAVEVQLGVRAIRPLLMCLCRRRRLKTEREDKS